MTAIALSQFRPAVAPCPLCGGISFSELTDNDRHRLGIHTVGCNQCGLVQTNPRPDETGLADFYGNYYRRFYQGVTDPSAEYIAKHNKSTRLKYTVEFLREYFPFADDSKVLDYGCSEGALFATIRESGFAGELYGIESNKEFGAYAASRNKAFVSQSLSGIPVVDCVVINHVLEHVSDPMALLVTLRKMMSSNGVLYIDVPDVERYQSIDDLHIAHIYHFSWGTLRALVEAAGFDVVLCEPHNPPFHPKSIRVVAIARAGISAVAKKVTTTDRRSEAKAWNVMRNVQRNSWKVRMRGYLKLVPGLRSIYRAIVPLQDRGDE